MPFCHDVTFLNSSTPCKPVYRNQTFFLSVLYKLTLTPTIPCIL